MMEITAIEVINSLLALLLILAGYIFNSHKRYVITSIERLKAAIDENGKDDEKNIEKLENKIERHYAYKSDITRLDGSLKHLEKDVEKVSQEVSISNNLLREVLLELKKD